MEGIGGVWVKERRDLIWVLLGLFRLRYYVENRLIVVKVRNGKNSEEVIVVV